MKVYELMKMLGEQPASNSVFIRTKSDYFHIKPEIDWNDDGDSWLIVGEKSE